MQHRGIKSAWLLMVTACLQYLATPNFAQVIQCPAPGGIVLNLAHLAMITNVQGCNHVNGDLKIGHPNCNQPCQLTDFTTLNAITTITGSLRISCCSLITDLSDFNSLTMITGSLELYYNQNLTRISGFRSLVSVGGSLQISQHPKLQVVTGLSRLSTINGFLTVERNTALYELEGFSGLITIEGDEVQSGHALSLLYNTNITSLSAFRSIVRIAYGTIHIEGNTQLCYAGYPTWNIGSYLPRKPVDGGGDVGVDWRTKLNSNEVWQYTWGVEGGGYPTLIIQNNAPAESCVAASCHSSCLTNAGCLGPNDPSLCGSCDLVGDVNPCEIPGPPTSAPRDSTPVIYGVVFTIIGIIALILLALGIWLAIVLFKKWKESRQGSFDISLGGIESGRSGSIEMVSSDKNRLYASKQIAEPTPQGSTAKRSGLRSRDIDSVVMASYKKDTNPELSTTVSPRRQTTPTSTPSERHTTTVKSSLTRNSPVVNVSKQRYSPEKQKHSPAMQKHPITATKAPISRSISEAGARSNTFPSSREISTESILERMRQQQAEIPMNFPHNQIKLSREIGTGDFGKVYQAEAKKLLPGQKKTSIVVKKLKEGATKQERDTFLRPVEAMKLLQHPNVLSLLGVSTQGPSILVMLEYCSQGNFKTYLVRKRKEAAVLKSSGDLLKMAIDMANGLMYLHTKNIAHNDFAVRSCLVTSESTVKLGDYGITRQTFKEDYYCRGPNQKAWPIRWMAPEQIVIQGRNILDSLPVSVHANIWSFGIALWEICSFAQWPYEEMSNEEVIQTLKETGSCVLENPLKANDPLSPLFDICQMCWRPAKQRPKMSDILALLGELQKPGGVRKVRAMIASMSKGESSNTPPPSKSKETIKSEPLTRPKRPAPKKPPVAASKTRDRKGSGSEPLIISNPSMSSSENGEDLEESIEPPKSIKKPISQSHQRVKKELLKRDLSSSTEPLITSSGSQSSTPTIERAQDSQNATVTSTASKEKKRKSPKVGKKSAKSKQVKNIEVPVSHEPSEAESTLPPPLPSPIKFKMEVTPNEAELPLPGEMSEAKNEVELMATKSAEREGEEDDFILEPPERFSQSSLDDIDYDGPGSAGSYGLEFAFSKAGPTFQSFSYHLGPTDSGDISEEEYGDSLGDHQTGATLSSKQEQEQNKASSSASKVAMANATWMSNEQEFEEFDRRDALEEDDIPNIIYDEDVAALIW